MQPGIFREYDIRGVVKTQLTAPVVEDIGRAFGTYLLQQGAGAAVVGYDNRATSPELFAALSEGLLSTGCDVIDIGCVVTPILYFARLHFGIDGGVMITGSHNPPEFNGFKLASGPGTIYGEQIQQLYRIAQRGDFARGRGRRSSRDAVPAYLQMLRDKITLGPRPLKVVADAGNGTAALFAEEVIRGWGCAVVPLYCTSDPTFPHHHPDPVKAENLADLQRVVVEQGADLGVAYDGDADRIGVVDDRGRVVWGDQLMCLYWREILAARPGSPAIIEVKCSQALFDEVQRLGGKPFFYRTGHSLIKAKMREVGAPFAGEMSGHMFFADEFYGHDDAFYATGRLLRLLSGQERPLSELIDELPRFHVTPEVRVDCADDLKFAVVDRLKEHFHGRRAVIDVDGVRVLFAGGWGLVRASNTQPVLVLRCEGSTAAELEAIKAEMAAALQGVGVTVGAWV